MDIDTIKAMLAKLPDSKWSWDKSEHNVWIEDDDGDSLIAARIPETGNDRWAAHNSVSIGEFIAASPEIVRFLLDKLAERNGT